MSTSNRRTDVMVPNTLELERAATEWVVRVHGERSLDAARALGHWLDASDAHRVAYTDALTLWYGLAAATLGPERARAEASRWVRTAGAWAAGALMAVVVAIGAVRLPEWTSDHRGVPGETASVRLDDGSTVSLTANGLLDADIGSSARTLVLNRGALFVEVAPDRARPFSVHAGDVVATAVGTAFGVERNGDGVSVSVEHGVVEVKRGGERIVAAAGETIVASATGLLAQVRDARGRPAWVDGRVVLERVSLRTALDALDDWTQAPVVCRAAACDDPVSLVTPVAKADAAVAALARERKLTVLDLGFVKLVVQ